MRLKITIGIAALALGAALASGPAFAQQGALGHSSDGAGIAAHHYRHHHAHAKSLFDVVPARKGDMREQKPSGPALGRNQNDGGLSK
jgi:hypothetical protein